MNIQSEPKFLDPLQQDEILEKIFMSLNYDDLLCCRQVCTTWQRESAKVMCLRAKVSIDLKKNGNAIQEFKDIVEARERTFSGTAFVSSITIKSHAQHKLQFPVEFWTVCGRFIKTLQLIDAKFVSGKDFRDVILKHCPNLETLCLENVGTIRYTICREPTEWTPPTIPQNWNLKSFKISHVGPFPISWMEIFSRFPALEELDIQSLYHQMYGGDSLLRSLILARTQNDQCWKLKSMRIDLSLIDTSLLITLLETRNLSLETLGISEGSNNRTTVHKILEMQAGSLKKLDWIGRFERSQVANSLPLLGCVSMWKVEELELSSMPLRSLRFLHSFPVLKKLRLREVENTFDQEDDDRDNWTIEDCKELELDPGMKSSFNALRRLHRRLPNVEILKISGIDNEDFRLICELWHGLRFLQISSSTVSEAGISGLDDKDVKKINRNGTAEVCGPFIGRRANITDLKCLESFAWEGSNKFRLGYCAARYGIEQLPHLKHLRIDDYPRFDWSQMCKEFQWTL